MISRRAFLGGAAALLAPPSLYLAAGAAGLGRDENADLYASYARRYTNPLRLPGDGALDLVPAKAVSRITAEPVRHNVRGNKSTELWFYRAEAYGRSFINPILTGRPNDRVALRFANRIAQPSIIHWHGFANDSINDGGMTSAAPGADYDYDWRIRGGAGLNWYHPHPHRYTGEQVWRGMSGLFIVEDDASDALARQLEVSFGETDIPLVIQDRTLRRSGELRFAPTEADAFHGMTGADIIVNMTRFPMIPLPRRWVRFRILNGSNARVYRLAFQQGDDILPFALLGTDGALLHAPQSVSELFLAPAQRIDIALDLRQASVGDVWLKTLPFDPMHNELAAAGDDAPLDTRLDTSGDHSQHFRPTPTRPAQPAAFTQGHVHGVTGEGAEEPVLRIAVRAHDGAAGTLPDRMGSMAPPSLCAGSRDFLLDHDGRGQWRINRRAYHHGAPAFEVGRAARENWNIRNSASSMPHPMHLHGFAFEVAARSGSPQQVAAQAVEASGRTAQDLGRLDTVLVWPGETVSIEVDFSMPFAGSQQYMFHCHNLEHEDQGMMLAYAVGGSTADG